MHATSDPAPADFTATAPRQICGCEIERALSGNTFLAIGPGGRSVVLKRMEDDCLLRGLLHPSIRERLQRVRELAHARVANLFGVGVEGEHAYLIWEYVGGRPFLEHAAANCHAPKDFAVLSRELILSVEALHLLGIVHGAIKSGNVIVDQSGSVRLTGVSPLLYNDPEEDVSAITHLLTESAAACGAAGNAAGQMLSSSQQPMQLRALAAMLTILVESRDAPRPQKRRDDGDRWRRRRSLAGAGFVAAIGLALGLLLYQAIHQAPPRSINSLTRVIAPQ